MPSTLITSRRSFLGLVAGLAASTQTSVSRAAAKQPLSVAVVGESSASSVPTFYLSAAGDDAADGRSVSSAWRSIDRLNAAMANGTVGRGAVVRFRRGDTFFGRVQQPGHHDELAPWTVFTSYGAGQKPVISAYKLANNRKGWTDRGAGVWRIDLRARSGAFAGDVSSDKTDVGFIKVDGILHGVKRSSYAALAKPWDFYCKDGYCFVKLSYNPASRHDVRIAPAGPYTDAGGSPDIFTPMTKTAIVGLEIMGTGGHGIVGSAYWRPKHVQIVDCDVHEIGGAYLPGYGDGRTRYGNGVQAWIGQSDWLIEQNRIWDCYDAAITFQGDQDSRSDAFTRLRARNNTIWACSQSFEVWTRGTDGAGFVDCEFTGNLCYDAGRSWGHGVRPDPEGRGCHVLVYEMQLPVDLRIERNVFFGAATNYSFMLDGAPRGLVMRRNAVYLHSDLPLQTSTKAAYRRTETAASAASWQQATGLEVGSTVLPEPSGVNGPGEASRFLSEQHGLPDEVITLIGRETVAQLYR